MWPNLRRAAKTVGLSLKINYSFGAILEHKAKRTLRYYHTSPKHSAKQDRLALVRTEADLIELFKTFDRVDIMERVTLQRPNTQWKMRAKTKVSYFFYRLTGAGRISVADNVPTPRHLLEKRWMAPLLRAR